MVSLGPVVATVRSSDSGDLRRVSLFATHSNPHPDDGVTVPAGYLVSAFGISSSRTSTNYPELRIIIGGTTLTVTGLSSASSYNYRTKATTTFVLARNKSDAQVDLLIAKK